MKEKKKEPPRMAVLAATRTVIRIIGVILVLKKIASLEKQVQSQQTAISVIKEYMEKVGFKFR